MKLSFSQLEQVRGNPKQFGRQLASGGVEKQFMTRGYFMDWRDAVLAWHKTGEEPTASRTRLEETLERRFTKPSSIKRIGDTCSKFDSYVSSYSGLGYRPVRTRMDVELPLAGAVASVFNLSGELPLLSRAGTAYTATLLLSKEAEWKNQLRTPLLQLAISAKLNLLPGALKMAAYTFELEEYEEIQYDDAALARAIQELEGLLDDVRVAMSEGN